MREGSLEAPTRHVIPWEDPAFSDRAKTEAEMHRPEPVRAALAKDFD